MIINLSPQVSDKTLTISKKGDVITINKQVIDLSPLGEGSVLPSSAVNNEFLIGNITRIDGEIVLTILLPILWDDTEDARFPTPLTVIKDGTIKLPGRVNDN